MSSSIDQDSISSFEFQSGNAPASLTTTRPGSMLQRKVDIMLERYEDDASNSESKMSMLIKEQIIDVDVDGSF